jgi:hypothetical protein
MMFSKNISLALWIAVAAAFIAAAPAGAQSSTCQLMLLPSSAAQNKAEYIDAADFLGRVYDGSQTPKKTAQNKPIRAVICPRARLIPTMRDFPILNTGLPLSLSENFDDPNAGLLTVYDTGAEFRADYSGPKLSPALEDELRDRLEIFNLQKLAKQ